MLIDEGSGDEFGLVDEGNNNVSYDTPSNVSSQCHWK